MSNLKPFPKGVSGNPGGRKKSLAGRIRELTDDGAEVIAVLLDIMRGSIRASARDRLEAARILMERGYGKSVEVSMELDPLSAGAAGITNEALEVLANQISASMGQPAPQPAPLAAVPDPNELDQ